MILSWLSDVPDADNFSASPLHLHQIQKGVELESQVAFPDLREWHRWEFLDRLVHFQASGLLPRSGASASYQDWGRGQASIVVLGLHLGHGGRECKESSDGWLALAN